MEGITVEKGSNVESLDLWRALKEAAPLQAQTLLAELYPHFELLSVDEKSVVIDLLVSELAVDNKNRFVARELAAIKAHMIETTRHEQVMNNLS